jgi:hypothetical protein
MFAATTPDDALTFTKDSPVIAFNNGGPSNPHMSLEYKGEVFVPDLVIYNVHSRIPTSLLI